MKTTKTVLAAVAILIAFAGYSQAAEVAPTPPSVAGTYLDKTLTIPQRLRLAHDVIETATEGQDVLRAAIAILGARPVVHAVTEFPGFADEVLRDPTLGGKVQGPRGIDSLRLAAIGFKTETIPTDDGKLDYLKAELAKAAPEIAPAIKVRLAGVAAKKADKLNKEGNYAGAIAAVEPYLGFSGGTAEIKPLFVAKRALRAPDVLSWAKLLYVTEKFSGTQAGIDAVSSAFRALDANLVRANAFIAYQKDGQGENPLAGVQLPEVKILGVTPWAKIANYVLEGKQVEALNIAVQSFATAPTGPKLNDAASLVAQCLRNIDGNLVRANEFVSAQTEGRAFTIAELE